MRENSFAYPWVKLQTSAATGGLYRSLRMGAASDVPPAHPFFRRRAAAVGLVVGVAMAPLFVVLFAIRTRIEETRADRGLPEYADYTAQVAIVCLPGLVRIERATKMAYSADDSHSRSGPMPHVKIYTGGCHCGLVAFSSAPPILPWYLLQLLDLHQEGAAFRIPGRGEFSPCAPARTI